MEGPASIFYFFKMNGRINRNYDRDIIRRESFYDRRYGAGVSTAAKLARYASAAYRVGKKAAEAYTWYKVAKGPQRALPEPASGPANKSRTFATKSSLPQNDRGRKRIRSEDLNDMARNIRRRTPARSRSRSRGRSRNRRPTRSRTRSRSVYSVRRGGGLRRSRNYPRRSRSIRNRVRRVRQFRMPPPNLHGVYHCVERSGAVTVGTNNAMYIGHGVDMEQFWVNLCRGIIRKLYRLAGEEINDWNAGVTGAANSYFLQIAWVPNVDQDTLNVDNTLIGAISYAQVADALYTRFAALFAELDANILIQHVSLFGNVAVVGNSVTVAKLVMNNCNVFYKVTSRMKIQNASLAGSGAADIADEDTTNVTKNPLVGKMYWSKGRANGFKLNMVRSVGAAETVKTLADFGGGFGGTCIWGVSDISSAEMKDLYKKPPPAYQFCMNGKDYGISPGSIKTFSWVDTRKISLHKLIEICKTTFTQRTGVQYCTVGKFQMVGLEKKMSCLSNEPLITVHWALEQHHSFVVTKNLGKANRIMQFADPAALPVALGP